MVSQSTKGYQPPIPGWALAILLYMVIFFTCGCFWLYKRRQEQEEESLAKKCEKTYNGHLEDDTTQSKYNLRKPDKSRKDGPKLRGIGTRKIIAGPPPTDTGK